MVPPAKVGGGVKISFRLALCLVAGALALSATNYYVTIAGLGGEEDFDQRFAGWATDLDKTFRGAATAEVHTLHGADSTREKVRALFEQIAAKAVEDDALAVMLIGHGSYDGFQYKFNLVGPDITAVELGQLLDRVKAGRQMIADMTSSSGGALPALQRPSRVVITATKSGTEKNAVVFARYWAAALSDATSDTDKNEVISALEAFNYATRKTADFYTSQQRLATEHPVIEDTGTGEGVREATPENGQGLKAGSFPLLRIGKTQLAAQDPAKRALLEKKESIEQQIDKLKYEKAAMPLTEYRRQLTELLLELAKTQAELEQ